METYISRTPVMSQHWSFTYILFRVKRTPVVSQYVLIWFGSVFQCGSLATERTLKTGHDLGLEYHLKCLSNCDPRWDKMIAFKTELPREISHTFGMVNDEPGEDNQQGRVQMRPELVQLE